MKPRICGDVGMGVHVPNPWPMSLLALALAGCSPAVKQGGDASPPLREAPKQQAAASPPMYRALPNLPPESIADNAYGMYLSAKDAPEIGSVIPPFSLPVATGGTYALPETLERDLVIVFYRGFW